ncbi:MAG: diacylglycerol kinase [Pseudomonadales bacterium]|nr:diacylglycerol kinase [Pseudomonadales bacterium]
MAKPGESGLARMRSATRYSVHGLRCVWRQEAAFRQEASACLVLIPTAFFLAGNAAELALLAGSCVLVLIVEILNTAIEAVVDRIGNEAHDLSGLAKDLGSAAVFTSLLLVLLIWGIILLG